MLIIRYTILGGQAFKISNIKKVFSGDLNLSLYTGGGILSFIVFKPHQLMLLGFLHFGETCCLRSSFSHSVTLDREASYAT